MFREEERKRVYALLEFTYRDWNSKLKVCFKAYV